jgi:isopentenyl-diphosphate delta-isomerase
MIMKEMVILVDENDNEIGVEEKLEAHIAGLLHRAFSIFCVNSEGEMLLQKRARGKYHSGGLWTNTCCSHPEPGETLDHAVHRRLFEEMGFDCELKKAFHFTYKASLDNGLTEHEYDHVFIGEFDGEPKPNIEEVEAWKFISIDELREDLGHTPEAYTFWFRVSLEKVIEHL